MSKMKKDVRLVCMLSVVNLCGLLALAYQINFLQVVECKKIVLIDAAGSTRCVLVVDEFDNAPILSFMDAEGRHRMSIGLSEQGEPGVLMRRDGKLVVLSDDAMTSP